MSRASQFLEIEHIYAQTLGKGIRSLAVVAANSDEGCSTLACALAERHEASGRSTLLVDMNLYRPSLDSRFHIPRSHWNLQDETRKLAIQPFSSGINVLTASMNSALAFREGNLIKTVIDIWLEEFDSIIFDTSPLNAVNRNNIPPELVCGYTEATILMILAGRTTENDILRARAKLSTHKANLIGAVFNDRHNPRLASEMIREVSRFKNRMPRLVETIIRAIRNNDFLNQPL